jgi:hypothetical protein
MAPEYVGQAFVLDAEATKPADGEAHGLPEAPSDLTALPAIVRRLAHFHRLHSTT